MDMPNTHAYAVAASQLLGRAAVNVRCVRRNESMSSSKYDWTFVIVDAKKQEVHISCKKNQNRSRSSTSDSSESASR